MRATATELTLIAPCVLVDATTAVIKKMHTFVESWGPMTLTPTPFPPIVGGADLPQAPWSALANGGGRDVQLLVGHTRDEYWLFNTWRSHEVTDEQVSATLERLMPASDTLLRTPYLWMFRTYVAGQGLDLGDAREALADQPLVGTTIQRITDTPFLMMTGIKV